MTPPALTGTKNFYLASIDVMMKPTVVDPQGDTVLAALKTLGFLGAQAVRVGKHFELSLEAGSPKDAEARVKEICEKLLSNPVIESFTFVVRAAE